MKFYLSILAIWLICITIIYAIYKNKTDFVINVLSLLYRILK